jgi:hypothetical protein
VSPIASPISSIEETKSEEDTTQLPFLSPKTGIEIFQMVEDLQLDIIQIRTDHSAKHDHLVNLLDMLLSGQASERETSASNSARIIDLAESHVQIVAKVDKASTASSFHIDKIASFEKKIDDFLSGATMDESSHKFEPPPPALLESPPMFDLKNVKIPANVTLQTFLIYHNDFDSEAPRIERNTNVSRYGTILNFSFLKYAGPRRLFDPGKMFDCLFSFHLILLTYISINKCNTILENTSLYVEIILTFDISHCEF